MNDLPRHTLARVIAKHGRGICDAPKRVEALLRDLCGAYRREINIIMGALEERVAADLIAASNTAGPRAALLARLAARLRDNLAYTPEAARWAVETWAFALGILSEAEFQERARAETATDTPQARRSAAPPTLREAKPSAANRPSVAPQAPQPQRATPFSPPPPSPTTPSKTTTAPPPVVQRPTPPPPRRMPAPPPQVAVPALTPTPRQRAAPALPTTIPARRRGLTLRGCFIFVVLVIVLIIAAIFVVPAVIMLLQEEQARPSINDPRIR